MAAEPVSIGHSLDDVGHTGGVVGQRDSHVTVLLSTFDGARWLPELLDSLRAQTHTEWSLVVRDDGSSDGTAALLEEAASVDPRIRVVEDDRGNLGPTASFLTLLAEVHDGLFAFCDQDDVWHPDKLATSIEALGLEPLAAVYTDARVVDGAGTVLHESALAQRGNRGSVPYGHLLINNAAIGATVVGTAALAERAVAMSDDVEVLWHDWWVALVAGHQGELTVCPQATIDWRRHGSTVTGGRPSGVADRAARRRRYLAFSIAVARRLAREGPGPDSTANAAVVELARLDPHHPTVLGLVRAWRRAGVRAWPRGGQASLLFSTAVGRSDQ